MNWIDEIWGLRLIVPIHSGIGEGTYDISISKRPHYCDRGDWLIMVAGINNDLDYCDGFPRYFFGTKDEVKAQMERWLSRRSAYRNERRNSNPEV